MDHAAEVFDFVVHAEHALTYLKAMQHWTCSFSMQPCGMLSSLVHSQWTHEALEPSCSRLARGLAV